nr:dTDP-4-dehydrorhamnose 3,5-epimerase [Sinorhizobium medicae]
MSDFGTGGSIAQINYTLTREKGTIRGMHYQRPPMTKPSSFRAWRASFSMSPST